LCRKNPCNNGGKCSILNNSEVCVCVNGYSGDKCEIEETMLERTCANNPCENGATCKDQNSSSGGLYFCECAANFYGKNCNYEVTDKICNSGDSNGNCTVWKSLEMCNFRYTYNLIPIPVYCPTTCGLCKDISGCIDEQANCAVWASMGLCGEVDNANICKKSCGTCPKNVL
jgi:hypothetical protein